MIDTNTMQPDPVWYFPAEHHVQLTSATRPDPNTCRSRDARQDALLNWINNGLLILLTSSSSHYLLDIIVWREGHCPEAGCLTLLRFE